MMLRLLLVGLVLAACGTGGSNLNPASSRASPLINETNSTGGLTGASESLDDLRAYLLELINGDRTSAGLSQVVLGSNPAAQEHAEEMLEHSYLSHWGLDGMTPYMRYTLAGGVNYEAENGSGVPAPPEMESLYRTISPKEKLREIERDWMGSPGHRKNILYPWHKKVNLGIACNRITCAAVQQFEGDYIEFDTPPTLSSGVLSMTGKLSGGFQLSSIQVWYHQPHHPLTLGQLDKTYCYTIGESPVAFLRTPLLPGTYYPLDADSFTWDDCPSPYEVSPDTPRPKPGFAFPQTPLVGISKVTWVTALMWRVAEGTFSVQADLTQVMESNGPGVYTVLVWGDASGEDVVLTNYSIFVE